MDFGKYDYCIVGAGVAGLTCAYKLLQAGKSVVVVERDSRVGGLAKSFLFEGNVFDIGPKRFHTDDEVVLDFLSEIMGDKLTTIDRLSMVYFFKKYFNWPLSLSELKKLPPMIAIKSFLDILTKPKNNDGHSFVSYIKSRYGKTLFEVFFAPYTEKFLRLGIDMVHSDWAKTGINRTTIDKRTSANSSFDIVKSLLLPQKVKTKFLYPTGGGFGAFCDCLYDKCSKIEKFQAFTSATIVDISSGSDSLVFMTSCGKKFAAEQLIWSGNINDLAKLISDENTSLAYLNTVFFNFVFQEKYVNKNRAQWIYISKGDSLISRITCMKEFAPYTCLSSNYNIICEVTDSSKDPVYFNDPDSYIHSVLEELHKMKFIDPESSYDSYFVNCIRDTYPVYDLNYRASLNNLTEKIKQFSPRVSLLGRSGSFWYNNADHSIRMAIELSNNLLGISCDEFDNRSYFG